MKLFERLLPAFLKGNLVVYNLTVLASCVLLFFVILIIGGVGSIFLAFLIDTYLKKQGHNLEIALFAVIILLVAAVMIADFVLCVALLLSNLKWPTG